VQSPRLSVFAAKGDRIHVTCVQPRCPYGGRTHMAADLLARHGDITLEQLKARAACGEWIKRRDEGIAEPRHRVFVEVSSAPDGWGGFSGRDGR
jgi:hypothetical protein